jgi:chromate reductase, NAD(P)H dehydrogenase (quinone)
MIHVPRAHEVFDDAGGFLDGVDTERWRGYFGRGLDQLRWWTEAAQKQRERREAQRPSAFTRDPSQRDAP